ncbi:MAG: D-aminoacyl-tRNA deacylase [Candidatus Syntrophoarchaeum sp.]|nr:D-aminoacyl-tRNA deacylase [Candidatus Syntrophoarchaeum sp.]
MGGVEQKREAIRTIWTFQEVAMNTPFQIVHSSKDPAGSRIARFIREAGEEVLTLEEDLLYMEKELETDLIVFASRHKSESGKPSFTVHAPGNFNRADFGGKPSTLGMASAIANRTFLEEFHRRKVSFDAFDISLEVTHHGPTLDTPSVFVELGSSEKEWGNLDAAKLVADVIVNGVKRLGEEETCEIAIGFGGGHYAPKFTREVMKAGSAISHICPKYQFEHLTPDMIDEMLKKTVEEVEIALIDWKSFRKDERNRLIRIIEASGIEWRRV